ncbi:DUF2793 domain-containing protein [Tabrizicola sp. J26]|uniref:DUF2793 domain-containing protein n=1 Tax=Alitabrizicola rongguiensis TaxID=2909234 RepID=UPI001F253E87|nr:DUF2793 domain-containing protein [Tabrizicola rongguiensis]MCF1708583.1 DUF2793 domain-containing protein [Tabrizicola rongguiensis]
MSEVSAVLALPYIQPAQAQKHVTHNEALRVLDVIVQLAVLSRSLTAPPAEPAPGERHIVGEAATGAWAGQDGKIAVFDIEGWVFFAPLPGWRAEVLDDGASAVFDGSAWTTRGVPLSVDRLGINTSPDGTNRFAVASAATLLTHEGAGHQLKVNKATVTDTASLLFQTGFSGRAEMGLAGNDDFSIKVSSNGTAFAEGLRVGAGGAVSLPGGALLPDGTAALPGLRFAADVDTGLARPGVDQIGLVAGGVQRALLSGSALQLDVPLAGTAVSSGSHDATAGRVARVFAAGGIFGLGVAQGQSLGAAVADAAAVTVSGFYRTDIATANLPISAASGLLEVFHGAGGDSVQQRWTATSADAAMRTWLRRSSGGTWTGWSLVMTQSTMVGTVSQSGGLPTGAAIERGSNANGEYTRFADGTQICTIAGLSVSNASTATGALYRSGSVFWSYPASFSALPVVKGEVDDSDAWAVGGTPTLTQMGFRAVSAVSKSTALSIRALAIGRWF